MFTGMFFNGIFDGTGLIRSMITTRGSREYLRCSEHITKETNHIKDIMGIQARLFALILGFCSGKYGIEQIESSEMKISAFRDGRFVGGPVLQKLV